MTIATAHIPAPAAAAPPHNGFSLISNEKLLALYTAMLKCRMIDERIRMIARRNGARGRATASRTEAASVAVAAAITIDLLGGDTLAPAPHGFAACFVKGLSLDRIASALGSASTPARSPSASLKLISPALGAAEQFERAIAAAARNKAVKNKKIAVAFIDSSRGSSDYLRQPMLRAGKSRLPILFVSHSGPETDKIGSLAQKSGIPVIAVDGNDAVAIYRVATETIAHARRGRGPTLIQCRPWPVDDPQSSQRAAPANPIRNMENYLARKGLFTRKLKSEAQSAFRRQLDAAF